jgi:hypothetical protein
LEAKGIFTLSTTGRASISARRATVFPGLLPYKIATTPVCATLFLTSRPNPTRCFEMYSAVLYSLFESSGFL